MAYSDQEACIMNEESQKKLNMSLENEKWRAIPKPGASIVTLTTKEEEDKGGYGSGGGYSDSNSRDSTNYGGGGPFNQFPSPPSERVDFSRLRQEEKTELNEHIAKEMMRLGARYVKTGELNVAMAEQYLRGTKHHEFGMWFGALDHRGRQLYDTNHDGVLDILELERAVRGYLESHLETATTLWASFQAEQEAAAKSNGGRKKASAILAEVVRKAWEEEQEATALFALLQHWPDVTLEECGMRILSPEQVPQEWGVHPRDLPTCGSMPSARAIFPDSPPELVHVHWDCPFFLSGRDGGFIFHQIEPANVTRSPTPYEMLRLQWDIFVEGVEALFSQP